MPLEDGLEEERKRDEFDVVVTKRFVRDDELYSITINIGEERNKVYMNIRTSDIKWAVVSKKQQTEHGFVVILTYKDDSEMLIDPCLHKMGFTLDQANEIVFGL